MDTNKRKSSPRIDNNMDRESRLLLRKMIIDIVILFCVGFLILVFYLWGEPYKRGFYCDDESLKHPYIESTVTNLMLYIIGLGMPICAMTLSEWVRLRNYKGGRVRSILGREIPPWLCEAYSVVGIFLFGCACQQLTTDVAKYTVGRLRPHFFNVCKPDVDCNLPENKWRYIENFTCLGADLKLLKEMRLSFPSGHSSFSAYTMIYFSMYLQRRVIWRDSKLTVHALQFVLFMFAWYTAMSRISDYKHHWSDVLAGFGIGTLYAIIIFTYISNLAKPQRLRMTNHEAELHTTNGSARTANAGWQV